MDNNFYSLDVAADLSVQQTNSWFVPGSGWTLVTNIRFFQLFKAWQLTLASRFI